MDESLSKEEIINKKIEPQPDLPKLSQNAQKLKDLEDKMCNIEVIYITFRIP